ncbi:YccF domain-containing protein [Caulobacter sp. S45]|uniref:YccF domain-containing protein n=1 Tax=Caulobacter sp. S45 TaxID=1641861 RepID=UPI0035304924
MTLLLNVLWFVFGGWVSGLLWLLTALVLAVTIVGLPWAAAAFRLGLFAFAPFGRTAIPRTGLYAGRGSLDVGLNLAWVVLAGWWLALHHLVIGALQALTIIGISLCFPALQAGWPVARAGGDRDRPRLSRTA